MKALTRQELSLMLVWAFREQAVETARNPHTDALTLYCNVMALPVQEAAAIVKAARSGQVPPSDPVALALWTRGLNLLRDMLQQPMCELRITEQDKSIRSRTQAA